MIAIVRIFFYVVFGYFLLLLVVFSFQRSLQYYPNKNDPGNPAAQGLPEMRVVKTRTDDDYTLVAWYAPPKKTQGPVVVMFHGNAGNISHRTIKARTMIDQGLGIMMVEYRGYGSNKGRPTESGLYSDARAALAWLEGEGIKSAQMILYGESLGTGVAVQMATEMTPYLLVLEAPFDSAANVAKKAYPFLPIDFLMQDRFDSIDKIKQIKTPLLIVHGDEDNVIPLALAKNLFEAANHPKEINIINGGGHADLYDHHAGHLITEWISKQTVQQTEQQP